MANANTSSAAPAALTHGTHVRVNGRRAVISAKGVLSGRRAAPAGFVVVMFRDWTRATVASASIEVV